LKAKTRNLQLLSKSLPFSHYEKNISRKLKFDNSKIIEDFKGFNSDIKTKFKDIKAINKQIRNRSLQQMSQQEKSQQEQELINSKSVKSNPKSFDKFSTNLSFEYGNGYE